jgi:hypothetical protein
MDLRELEAYRLEDAVKFHDELNPRLWERERLRPEVRQALLRIADDFRESLGLRDLNIKDITISGSNAAYTYTPHSDIDLHLVVDMPRDDEVYRELFDAKKYQYNDQNDFRIGDSDVELYVQDSQQPHESQGIYSVRDDRWLRVPSRRRPVIDDSSVKAKYEDLGHRIDQAIASGNGDSMQRLWQKIKDMRQAGLAKTGEFGVDNLVFKILRNNGTIERLKDAQQEIRNREMSLAERGRKRRKRRQWGYYGSFWYPGFGFAGSSEASGGDAGGGDGGGESIREAEVVSLQARRIAQIVKQYPIIFATGSREAGVDDVDLIFKDLRTNRIVAHVVGNNYKHIEINGKKLGGASYEIRINRQGLKSGGGAADYVAYGNPQRDGDEHVIFTLVPSKKKIEKTPGPGGTTKLRPDQKDVVNYMMSSGTYYGHDLVYESNEDWHTFLQKALGGKFMDEDLAVELGYVYRKYDGDLVFLQQPQTISGETITIPQEDWESQGIESPYEPRTPNLRYFNLKETAGSGQGSMDADQLRSVLRGFIRAAADYLGIKQLPRIRLISDANWTRDNGTFGRYNSDTHSLDLAINNRHPLDIIRTMAHEMTHARQNEVTDMPADAGRTGSPYEDEANAMAGRFMRHVAKHHPELFRSLPMEEDYDPNAKPPGPESPPEMPQGTVKVDVSDVYDWYKLGQHISDLEGLGHHDFGKGPPQTILSFGSEELEHKYLQNLQRLGLDTHDIDPGTHPGAKKEPEWGYRVDEVLDPQSAFDLKWDTENMGDAKVDIARTRDAEGNSLAYTFWYEPKYDATVVEFSRGKSWNQKFAISGAGEQFRVFATLLEAIRQYVAENPVQYLMFSAKEPSRVRLYQAMVNKYMPAMGYDPVPSGKLASARALVDKNASSPGHKSISAGKLPPEIQARYQEQGSVPFVLSRRATTENHNINMQEASGYLPIQKEKVDEVMDPKSAFDLKWETHRMGGKPVHLASTRDASGNRLEFSFYDLPEYDAAMVVFSRGRGSSWETGITGGGEQFKVFATLLEAVRKYVAERAVQYLIFSAKEPSQAKLYKALVDKYASSLGYESVSIDKLPPKARAHYIEGGAVPFVLSRRATEGKHNVNIQEASGYIPVTDKEARDPRYSMAITQDIRPGETQRQAAKMGWKTDRAGRPPLLMQELRRQLEAIKQQPRTTLHEHQDTAAQELTEVKMSPGRLRSWAQSPEAEGIVAGFEAEMVFRNTEAGEDGDYDEPDYDYDPPANDIEDIVSFFGDIDHYQPMGGRDLRRLEQNLLEEYISWVDGQVDDEWDNEKDDLIATYMLDNEWQVNKKVRVRDVLEKMGVEDDELKPDDPRYKEALRLAKEEFDQEVRDAIDDVTNEYHESAREEFRRDRADSYEQSDWLRSQRIRRMSHVVDQFDADWPIWRSGRRGGDRSMEDIGSSLSDVVTGMVKVSDNYHGTKRGPDIWIVEPDSSIEPDDDQDRGLEIVSPPMPLAKALEELRSVMDWARSGDGDAYTNSSTGLHMGVSVPSKQVDYVKLVLFMGDEHVLEQFQRSASTYCRSAMGKLRSYLSRQQQEEITPNSNTMTAMEQMRQGLLTLAGSAVQGGVGLAKYTSAHIKDGYIEFRSPGGDYLDMDISALENTMLRFAYAMSLATNPEAYRQQYAKKLYRLISPQSDDALQLFANFSAGLVSREDLVDKLKTLSVKRQIRQGKAAGAEITWRVTDPDYKRSITVKADSVNAAIEAATAWARSEGMYWNPRDAVVTPVGINSTAPAPQPAAVPAEPQDTGQALDNQVDQRTVQQTVQGEPQQQEWLVQAYYRGSETPWTTVVSAQDQASAVSQAQIDPRLDVIRVEARPMTDRERLARRSQVDIPA